MSVYFYDLTTGVIRPNALTASKSKIDELVALNTPAGCAPVIGVTDPLSQRVDLETGDVVEYQAPPDPQKLRDRAQARIAALELKQKRPHRELSLDPDNAEARRRLEAIDAEIAELRANLSATGG